MQTLVIYMYLKASMQTLNIYMYLNGPQEITQVAAKCLKIIIKKFYFFSLPYIKISEKDEIKILTKKIFIMTKNNLI